jgi:RNA polymerase-binding transcription factor DksA
MTDDERAALRELIVTERESTQTQIGALQRDFDEFVEASETDPPDDEHDPEGATIAWERMQTASLLENARAHLVALADALERLDRDDYGVCERCGQQIAFERLMARPTTRTCVACVAESTAWPLRSTS